MLSVDCPWSELRALVQPVHSIPTSNSASKLQLPDYYGENLDALWDILSSWNEPLAIIIEKPTRFVEQLGGYGESVLQLLQDAEEENAMISVEYRE